MVSLPVVNAISIAQVFARLAGQHPPAAEVWVRQRGLAVDLWLVTDAIDADAELELYDLEDAIAERFPGVEIAVHIVNAAFYNAAFDIHRIVPADAVRVSLSHG